MSMLSFPRCVSPSSTFNVAHPLHHKVSVFCQQQSTADKGFVAKTPTKAPYRLASPTMVPTGSRTPPVVSPLKRARKSRVVFDFSTEEMAKYFHMSQREAAQQLGVATVTIKRNCRRLGIVWPYRLMKSKKHAINCSIISRKDAQRIRQMRALDHVKDGYSPPMHSRRLELTEAGRAFARLPLDCRDD